MIKNQNGLFPFYCYESFMTEKSILHFVSSAEQEEAANLSLIHQEVVANRKRLAEAVGFSLEQLTVGQQTHSLHVRVVGKEERGKGGVESAMRLPETDAMVTDVPEICLMVMTADCVPLLLFEPYQKVIGVVHAGWRGTVGEIAGKTVEKMVGTYGCRPSDIRVGIGPSIGKCCFEVGEEVAEEFKLHFGDLVEGGEQPGKYKVDLWEANIRSLTERGVLLENIEKAEICTACHPHDFFSYRKSGGKPYRFASGIMLLP